MNIIHQFRSSAAFQMWDYDIIGAHLLLRSPAESASTDLVFRGVFSINLPSSLAGIEIRRPTPQQSARMGAQAPRPLRGDDQFFVLLSGRKKYHVGAASLVVETSNLSMNDPSFYRAGYLQECRQEDFYRQTVVNASQFRFPETAATF